MKNTNCSPIIQTDRLVLRQWNHTDFEPFAALNADPRVMEYFPSTLSLKESDDLAKRLCTQLKEQGWGLWAVSVPGIANFIGFIGLARPSFNAHFTPTVEIGWRLAFDYWGKGYATEGAKAALAFGFDTLNLDEIVSFTAVQNMRARRIMEKIGMHHSSKDDFDHPKLAEGHPLKRHVLYRMSQQEWHCSTHQKQKYVYKPYSKIFPDLFQKEKERITSSLVNALAIEHVGSTAIPELGGKGIIDIAISVSKKEMEHASKILQKLGYEYRPTFSTPARFYFVTYLADPEEGSRRYHIHLTYPSTKEWKELIGFRDYLKTHPEAIEEYANLKKQAAKAANQDGEQYRKMKEPIFQKINAFIKESDIDLRTHLISSEKEKKAALDFRQKHFFDQSGFKDPYAWTLDEKDHLHWLLYDRDKVIGYAHVQIWPEHRAALRIIVINEQKRGSGMGKYLMDCCEKELKKQGVTLLQTEASPNAYLFYEKLGYIEMSFNNPDGEATHPDDRAMGKYL